MMCFYILLYFNPRSREGSDEKRLRETEEKYQFQSTLPRGERLSVFAPAQQPAYFNPRSREGSDAHHPSVFFHFTHFNPRSREGSDTTNQSVLHCFRKFQSTLPRGERLHSPYFEISSYNFNPRSREGSDSAVLALVPISSQFQSTLPRGERRIKTVFSFFQIPFQSTLPRGERRTVTIADRDGNKISIHAPARGATSHIPCIILFHFISIHAPARGATLKNGNKKAPGIHFNPRSREGSDSTSDLV